VLRCETQANVVTVVRWVETANLHVCGTYKKEYCVQSVFTTCIYLPGPSGHCAPVRYAMLNHLGTLVPHLSSCSNTFWNIFKSTLVTLVKMYQKIPCLLVIRDFTLGGNHGQTRVYISHSLKTLMSLDNVSWAMRDLVSQTLWRGPPYPAPLPPNPPCYKGPRLSHGARLLCGSLWGPYHHSSKPLSQTCSNVIEE
jgi:hypothetical protein